MSQSVLQGRVSKRGQSRRTQVSNQLITNYEAELENNANIRKSMVKCSKELACHHEAIKYYFLTRRYTHPQLCEAMEIIFNIGATPKQYAGYLDRSNFKKKLSHEQWRAIASHYYASKALGREVAIKINGCYTIEPKTVTKEISRQISATEQSLILHQEVPGWQYLDRPFASGRLEVYTPAPTPTYEKIPSSVLSCLPIWESRNSLLAICQQNSQGQNGTRTQIGQVANSNYFRYLKVLLYRLSNNLIHPYLLDDLLDKVMTLGFRSSLKDLLSSRTISGRTAAENLLPLLILRCDEDMINHILKIHGQIPIDWYINITKTLGLEIRHIFSLMLDDSGKKKLLQKYHGARQASKFLANIIVARRILPRTIAEEVRLIAMAIRWNLISITTLKTMMAHNNDLKNVEANYECIFGDSILQSVSQVPVHEILNLGFRRKLHAACLDAVLFQDFERISELLSFTNIQVPKKFSEQVQNGNNFNNKSMWKFLGVKAFSELLLATEKELTGKETRSNERYRNRIRAAFLGCLISAACCLQDQGLFTFVLGFLGIRLSRKGLIAATTAALVEVINLSQGRCVNSSGCFHGVSWKIREWDWEELFEWCKRLVNSGADINAISGIPLLSGRRGTLLHLAIIYQCADQVEILLKLGADLNLGLGLNPINVLMDSFYKYKISYRHESFFEVESSLVTGSSRYGPRISYKSGLRSKKPKPWTGNETTTRPRKEEFGRMLQILFDAGARFPADYDIQAHGLQPEFVAAIRIGDLSVVYDLWDHQFEELASCKFCKVKTKLLDLVIDEIGGEIDSRIFRELHEDYRNNTCKLRKLCPHQYSTNGIYRISTDPYGLLKDSNGLFTKIHFILFIGDEVELLQKFLQKHPDGAKWRISESPSCRISIASVSPLQMAAQEGRTKCLLLLLQNGSDPRESAYPTGFSALHSAVLTGNLEIDWEISS